FAKTLCAPLRLCASAVKLRRCTLSTYTAPTSTPQHLNTPTLQHLNITSQTNTPPTPHYKPHTHPPSVRTAPSHCLSFSLLPLHLPPLIRVLKPWPCCPRELQHLR